MIRANTTAEIHTWAGLIKAGILNAVSGLSEMVGQEVSATSMKARQVSLKKVPGLLGGDDAQTTAVYLSVLGPARGHLVMVIHPHIALELVDLLMGDPPGTTRSLGDMEKSALGEMGNIMGSFFLNTLADATGLNLGVSPPAVMTDMAGAVIDAALAELMLEADEAMIVETLYGTRDRQIDGTFLIMPSLSLQRALIERCAA